MRSGHYQIETINTSGCLLGEGPVWDAKRGTIGWVDILRGVIYQFMISKKKLDCLDVKQMIGSYAICTDGRLLAALENTFAFIHAVTGNATTIVQPESNSIGNRFNDGKCDPAGRWWVGSMSKNEKSASGYVYMMNNDLVPQKKISGVTISNGMAWSIDGRTLYYIDTPTRAVVSYNFDLATGGIANRRVAINVDVSEGYPDGMTIDNEGMLWIAHWGGGKVTRWNPSTGDKLFAIKLPAANITSCTFGGENLDTLFITSARAGLSELELKDQPLAGSLFAIPACGYTGCKTEEFQV